MRVTTKSGKHEIADIMADGTVKIKLKSAPEKGKANEELIELLSDSFEIPRQNIKILTGETARTKLIEIHPE